MVILQRPGSLPVGGLGHVGIELHGELRRGVAGTALHHPGMDSGIDHGRDRDVTETVECERRSQTGLLDGRSEDSLGESAS